MAAISVSAHAMPESLAKMAATLDSPAKMATTPEPRHVTAVANISPKDFFWGWAIAPELLQMRSLGQEYCQCDGPTTDFGASTWHPQGLSTGCHRDCSLTSVIPVMLVAIFSVLAAHCTPKASPVHESAPEASPVHESAPEASSVHESAP